MTALLNKKILLSLGVIVFAVAVAISSTGAFFSDSETSTGNTFTAGAIDLKVDSTQHYNGNTCTFLGEQATSSPGYYWQGPSAYPVVGSSCSGTWTLKDLNPELDKFFNFADVKPGDNGENTVSLHIDNNDAYACVDIFNIQNNDNTLTDPEAEVPDDLVTGELGQNLNFLVWNDNGQGDGGVEGDNIWNGTEPLLTSGAAPSTNQSYVLAAPPGPALPGGTTGYIGVAWCAGTWSAPVQGATCDGSTMGNIAQTDSYLADVRFRVEQARNNPNFSCTPEEEPAPETASLTVIKHVVLNDSVLATADDAIVAGDFDMHVKNSVPTDVAGSPHIGVEGAGFTFTGLAAGNYTISENGPITVAGEHVDVTYSGDCSSNAISLAAGEHKTCTVTNTYVLNIL